MKYKNPFKKTIASIWLILTYSLECVGCAMSVPAPDAISDALMPTPVHPTQSPAQKEIASPMPISNPETYLTPIPTSDPEAFPSTPIPDPDACLTPIPTPDPEAFPSTPIPDSDACLTLTPTPDPEAYLTPLPDGGFTIAEEFIERLNYASSSNAYPKLYARYQGQLSNFHPHMVAPEYIIDLIELGTFKLSMIARIQIDIFFPFETKRQIFTIPLEDGCYDLQDGLWITDLNGDGIDDFIVDFGFPLAKPSGRAAFFLYDRKNDCYKNLGILYDATFYEEEGAIYEFHYTEAEQRGDTVKPSIVRSKYIIQEDSLVLMERLSETFPYDSDPLHQFSYTRRSPFPSFTLMKNIDGELKTIYSNVSEEKIDFSVWPERDEKKRVK